MVTTLLFAVVGLALAGLGFVAVPVSTTETLTAKSVRFQVTYQPYQPVSYYQTTILFWGQTELPNGDVWYCILGDYCYATADLESTNVNLWSTSTITQYSYTATSLRTSSSTSLVPFYTMMQTQVNYLMSAQQSLPTAVRLEYLAALVLTAVAVAYIVLLYVKGRRRRLVV